MHIPQFHASLATSGQDLIEAQNLRYQVFVREMGAGGAHVNHVLQRETDPFDQFCDHLLLRDRASEGENGGDGQVVGVYRLLRSDQAARAGGFYSSAEFDLTPLQSSGKRLLELGRSCLHPDYRGGAAMFYLWAALADYVAEHHIDILFGVASFAGTDPAKIAAPLSLLFHRHLAAADIRVRSTQAVEFEDLISVDHLDNKAAMLQIPPLIKGYLKLGGVVGQGVFVDQVFNTTDVCLILEAAQLNARRRGLIERGAKGAPK